MRKAAVAALAVGLFAAAVTPARGNVVAHEQVATPLSASGGFAIWSTFVAPVQRYRLRLYANGITRMLPVRSRAVPFDVDLGRDRRGRIVAVYSRCREEPRGETAALGPRRDSGSGCDVFQFDVASAKQRKLRSVSSKTASEYLPAIDGSRIAFARRYESRRGNSGLVAHLNLFNSTTRKTQALRSGPLGFYGNVGTRARPRFAGGPGPLSMDLSGRTAVVSWQHVAGDCPEQRFVRIPEVWLVSSTTRTLVTGGGCTDEELLRFGGAFLARNEIFYLVRGSHTRAIRYDPRSARHSELVGYDRAVAFGGTDTELFHTSETGRGFEIHRSDLPTTP